MTIAPVCLLPAVGWVCAVLALVWVFVQLWIWKNDTRRLRRWKGEK